MKLVDYRWADCIHSLQQEQTGVLRHWAAIRLSEYCFIALRLTVSSIPAMVTSLSVVAINGILFAALMMSIMRSTVHQ